MEVSEIDYSSDAWWKQLLLAGKDDPELDSATSASATPARRRAQRAEDAAALAPVSDDDEWHAWRTRILGDANNPAIDPDATDEQIRAALDAWHTHVRVLNRALRYREWPGQVAIDLYALLSAAHGTMVQPVALQHELAKEIIRGEADAGTRRRFAFALPDRAPSPASRSPNSTSAASTSLEVRAWSAATANPTSWSSPTVSTSPR